MTTLKQLALEAKAIQDESKHLWGDGTEIEGNIYYKGYPQYVPYQEKLMEMILSDDPVKYLKENS